MDFIGKKNIMISLSLIIIIIGLGSMAVKGLKYGIDFAGGTSIIIKFKNEITVEKLAKIREILNNAGIKGSPTVYGELEKEKNKVKIKAESDPDIEDKLDSYFHKYLDNIRADEPRLDINQIKENKILADKIMVLEKESVVEKIISKRPFKEIAEVTDLLKSNGITDNDINKNFITVEPSIQEQRRNINTLDKMQLETEFGSLINGNRTNYEKLAKDINNIILSKGGIIDTLEPLKKELNISDDLFEKLKKNFYTGSFLIEAVNVIGPSVGANYRKKAVYAIIFSLIGILIYISWRFQFKFAVGAIMALIHDVLITIGIFSITGMEFTTQIVAALLTIIGYSLNDTIVIFDRIRENLAIVRQKTLPQIINISITQSMSRTLMTSLTTLVAVLSLYVLGGEVYKDFAFALLIGVVVGTYSSIFIASPVLVYWKQKRK